MEHYFLSYGRTILALTIYHRFMLPYPDSDVKREGLTPSKLLEDFFKTFVSFSRRNI